MVKKLYDSSIIDKDLLYQSTGLILTTTGRWMKTSSPAAKYFDNLDLGYVYALIKTHKMKPEDLTNCKFNEIPVRLVQAAGRTYLGRVTALLELLLQPISVKYSKYLVEEYCKDSKSYTEDLNKWRKIQYNSNNTKENYYITTADVQALYPNVPRNLICLALKDALNICSDFEEEDQQVITDLTTFCLKNSIIKFNGSFFRQNKGIVTGENNSVSLANISLHYIVKQIKEINSLDLFRRYIDDIIYITDCKELSKLIQEKMTLKFQEFQLKLTYKTIYSGNNNTQIEFLDILHVTEKNNINGFYITDFVKPTAIERRFVNGNSFHPNHVYKAIITGEAKRLRRLNTHDNLYQDSIQRLRDKCIRSNFNKTITEEMINLVLNWEQKDDVDTDEEEDNKNNNKGDLVWATQFKSLIKLDDLEKKLMPKASITFRKPPTLGSQLLNYKNIAHKTENTNKRTSKKCSRCGLCGNFGNLLNMVLEINYLKNKDGKKTKLKNNHLNCKNYGIYAGICRICNKVYVGQTKNPFKDRFSGHRSTWKLFYERHLNGIPSTEPLKDEQSLFHHYVTDHNDVLMEKKKRGLRLELSEAFGVVFVEQPNKNDLNLRENYWISLLNEQ